MSSTISLLSSGARVVVTTHAADGTSIFHSDQVLEPFSPFGPSGSSFTIFDARPSVPVDNLAAPAAADLRKTLPRVPATGVNFCITNIAPRYSVPMHRTLSLDYAIVLAGEIVLALDGGDEKTVRAGEFIVQQGVNHAWHNRTDDVCRIAFVGVGSEKIRLASGEELGETVIKGPGK
ncbi:uncharacterized protein F4807DRAFT_152288 [Annulohypoxylon truncatum]|uniref:uncharacterized protein n=1 Tax=Annulohypoxylon truncatum TaxID=327061 RepID=UPI002007B9E7|nr:uncharacterized protein F4807DRAFT_152288 [Annulohypoxylon truncatum]KAI1208449.1 hypothetical protein F4807DRAFT_152288 [Annulohypoxylon truncatum]